MAGGGPPAHPPATVTVTGGSSLLVAEGLMELAAETAVEIPDMLPNTQQLPAKAVLSPAVPD